MEKREKIYTIYDLCGHTPANIRLLVHIEDAEIPGDWQFFSSAIVRVINTKIECEYSVKEWLTSMWQSPSGYVYICSMDGKIHYKSGEAWKVFDLGNRYSLNHIWGLNDREIYCCGLHGVLFQKDNNNWKRTRTDLKKDLLKIAGTSPEDLYALGSNGTLFYSDGKKWREIDSPTNFHLQSIFCESPNEVYICGENGMLFKGSKKGWERIDEVDFDLWDLEKFQGKILVAGGDEGILSIENKKLVPFKEGISVSGIKVIEDTLFGFDINTLHKFDGKNWDTRKFDFSQVIINT